MPTKAPIDELLDSLEFLGQFIVCMLDHVVPMKEIKKIFIDMDSDKPIYVFEERISGCLVMAEHSMDPRS